MALIPDSFIRDLIARTDIVEVIGERLELKRAGKEFRALSPFTNERTPSFFISPQKQMFFCFSSGKCGSVLSFLQQYDRLSFPEAVELLARRLGVDVPREATTVARQRDGDDALYDACTRAAEWFQAQLRRPEHAAVVEYLKKRGISGETARDFLLGYGPADYGALRSTLPDNSVGVRAGLLASSDKGVYDRFRDRVMFPIRDIRGRVISFGGRTMCGDAAKYLNGPETAIFHKGRTLYGLFEARERCPNLDTILVVEGYMDVIGLSQAGVRNVVSSLGTALTEDQLRLLFRYTKRIVFCFDGDRAGKEAGWKAVQASLPVLEGERAVSIAFMPDGIDPDELVLEQGREAFDAIIGSALPAIDAVVKVLASRHKLTTAAGRAELAATAAQYIHALPEGPHRDILVSEVARLTHLTPDRVLAAPPPVMRKAHKPEGHFVEVAPLVSRALHILLDSPQAASAGGDLEMIDDCGEAGARTLSAALVYLKENGGEPGAVAAFYDESQNSPHEAILRTVLQSEPLPVTAGQAATELQDILQRLESTGIKRKLADLTALSAERTLTEVELVDFTRLLQARQRIASVAATS